VVWTTATIDFYDDSTSWHGLLADNSKSEAERSIYCRCPMLRDLGHQFHPRRSDLTHLPVELISHISTLLKYSDVCYFRFTSEDLHSKIAHVLHVFSEPSKLSVSAILYALSHITPILGIATKLQHFVIRTESLIPSATPLPSTLYQRTNRRRAFWAPCCKRSLWCCSFGGRVEQGLRAGK
jgi:hypothetical protein